MSEDEATRRPHLTAEARRAQEQRRQKLARAMRDNLRRRKAQTRARAAAEATVEPAEEGH